MDRSRIFEERVATYYRTLGARSVLHDCSLAGQQVDVYIEEDTPSGQLMRTAIEAKYRSNPVGVNFVRKADEVFTYLKSKELLDRYIIVSSSGFTRACREAAKASGIVLVEIADLETAVARTRLGGRSSPVPTEMELLRYRDVSRRTSPPNRTAGVARPLLAKKLSEAHDVPVTVVLAPPGYGKTYLLSDFYQSHSDACLCTLVQISFSGSNILAMV